MSKYNPPSPQTTQMHIAFLTIVLYNTLGGQANRFVFGALAGSCWCLFYLYLLVYFFTFLFIQIKKPLFQSRNNGFKNQSIKVTVHL